ncbi:MAG: D-aminoacyl-tRNA deacylase [Legionella sp.]|nr:D-aminoacyl-tRNA deacylase [Legionella sp.]
MLTVIQRVSHARVIINDKTVGEINKGLLILCGFDPEDTMNTLDRMIEKCINYRIFEDDYGKMNLSLQEIDGELLLVPQFTIMADTQKGLRPSFSRAASPEYGRELFSELINKTKLRYPKTQNGCFGANMQVQLCNEGPATFLLDF